MATIIAFITWILVLYGVHLLMLPLFLRVSRNYLTAYGVSRALSFFVFAYGVWTVGLITGSSTFTIAVIIAAMLLIARFLFKCDSLINSPTEAEANEVFRIEAFYFAITLCVWVQTFFHPEIYWGEKPMDFTFLNYFTRLDSLPPMDPWASGNGLGYYYFGDFTLGLLHKISGLPTRIGYSFSLAMIAGNVAITLFTFFRTWFRFRAAAISAASVFLMGTFDTLYLFCTNKFPFGFDLYWATSRTLKSPGMNEYPLWSFLFADLHAHVIAIPIVIATTMYFAHLVLAYFEEDSPVSLPLVVAIATGWGMLVATNSWDYITVGVILGLGFLLLITRKPQKFWKISRDGLGSLVGSILVSLPFHLSVKTKASIGWGYVFPEEFNTFDQVFRIYGHWALGALIAGGLFLLEQKRRISLERSPLRIIRIILVAAIPLLIALGSAHQRQSVVFMIPAGVILIASLMTALGAILFYGESNQDYRRNIFGFYLIAAGVLLSLSECLYFMDRMNTTFKVYNVIWSLFGAAAVGLLALVWQQKSARIISAVLYAPCIVATIMLIAMMTTFNRINSPRPSIDGTSYLSQFNPNEQQAFRWLNQNIHGTPTIVEAFGPSYQEYTRFAMHTGLPVILGWEYHVQQRGTMDSDKRKQDIQRIYTSPDVHQRMQSLNFYGAQIIVIGKQERKAYGEFIEQFFIDNPAYFRSIYSFGSGDSKISLYTHRYAKSL